MTSIFEVNIEPGFRRTTTFSTRNASGFWYPSGFPTRKPVISALPPKSELENASSSTFVPVTIEPIRVTACFTMTSRQISATTSRTTRPIRKMPSHLSSLFRPRRGFRSPFSSAELPDSATAALSVSSGTAAFSIPSFSFILLHSIFCRHLRESGLLFFAEATPGGVLLGQ